jgi:hypothetical protein
VFRCHSAIVDEDELILIAIHVLPLANLGTGLTHITNKKGGSGMRPLLQTLGKDK